jgi:hypothetical protein
LLGWITALALLGPPPLDGRVTVEPGGGCLTPASVAQATGTFLRSLEVDPRLRFEVEDSGDAIQLRLLREDEVRASIPLASPSSACVERRAVVGLALAMMIDGSVLHDVVELPESEGEPEPEPDPEPEPQPEPGPRPEPAVEPEPARQPEPPGFRAALVASPSAAFALVGPVGFGGQLSVDLGFASWLDVSVGGYGLSGLRFELRGGRVHTALAAGHAEVCPTRAFGRLRPRLCLGAAGGAVIASGRDFEQTRRAILPWGAIQAGGDLDITLTGRIGLRIGGRAVAPLVRLRLDVRDANNLVLDARDAAPIGGLATIALVVRLTD